MNVVAWERPLKVTAEEEIKPLPVIVSVCEGEPTGTEEGETLAIVGCGLGVLVWAPLLLPPHPVSATNPERIRGR
jgi:hypothetical protein